MSLKQDANLVFYITIILTFIDNTANYNTNTNFKKVSQLHLFLHDAVIAGNFGGN